MTDKSILLRMDEEGHRAPRVKLKGTVRSDEATERYDVIGEVARGGAGVVHRGRDNDIGRDVALKVLHDQHLASPELVQRFVEEAQIGGQLQHPGIVPVYELGLRGDKRPYFAMKLVKGETLAARLAQRSGPGQERRALLAVFREICRTVAYAHARGVIHRDLKPSNIMIGNFGEVQVVDWGFAKVMRKGGIADESLAKKAERDRTMISTVRSGEGSAPSIAGSVMGTPAYMPPEQALGRVEELDEKSDLFSLGGILTEILTGEPPYTGSAGDRMTAASQARLEPAMDRLDACGADECLVSLCKRCLQPLPKDRPATAHAVADVVAEYLTNAEGRAHRARVRAVEAEAEAEEQRRRRRQMRLVGTGLLAALLLAACSWAWIDGQRRRRARDRRVAIETALQEAERLRAAEDWPAALAAADSAIELGHDGAIARAIRAEAAAATALAQREEEDDATLAELERIRGLYGQGAAGAGARLVTGFEAVNTSIDAAYVSALEERFGSIDESLERLKASRHAPELAANLGFWSWLRRTQLKGADWRMPDRLARALDPENAPVRDAVSADDATALLEIARNEGHRLPAALAAQVGLALTVAGHAGEAVKFLEQHQRRTPGDFWINSNLAHAAEQLEERDLALRYGTAALAVRPAHAGAWRAYGTALMHKGAADGAVKALRRATRLDPTDARAHNNLGVALSSSGDLAGAEGAYRGAIELLPEDAHAYSNLGLVFDLRGEFDRAIAAHEQAIERLPKWALPHFNLGVAFLHKGEFDDAIAAFRKALDLDPRFAGAYDALGDALLHVARVDEAATALRRAIALDPERASAHNNMGRVLSRQGARDGAIAAWKRAIEVDPDFDEAHDNLGMALWRWKDDFDAAEAAFQRALELKPSARVHVRLGTLLSNEVARYDEAIMHFREALALDPRAAYARHNIGITLSRKGDLEGAVAVFREAVELDPGNERAVDSLTRAEKALEIQRRLPDVLAGEDRPADAQEALGFAALAVRLRKDYVGALGLYREAIEADPDLVADPANGHRYDAACAAVLAGEETHAQALAWLRADLEAWDKLVDGQPTNVEQVLAHWKRDPDLAAVRDGARLAEGWEKLWADVDTLLRRAR